MTVTDVSTTCAVVIFSVKMSRITSVDGIKLKIEDKADRAAKVYKLICPIFRLDKTSLHQGLEKLSDGIKLCLLTRLSQTPSLLISGSGSWAPRVVPCSVTIDGSKRTNYIRVFIANIITA